MSEYGFKVGDFVTVDDFTGLDPMITGQITKIEGVYMWIGDYPEPLHMAGAIKLPDVISLEQQDLPAREIAYMDIAMVNELKAKHDAALERIKVLENVLLEALAYARTGLIPVEFEPYVFDGETRRLHWNEHMRIQIAKLIDAAIK